MKMSPCGRVAALPFVQPMPQELAFGIDLTLESTSREIAQVRSILTQAIEGLMEEFGARAFGPGVLALQFQDLADQLLGSAARRIDNVRVALAVAGELDEPAAPAPVTAPSAGDAEFF
ncbi:MAG TPA: hypothetical protein VFU92_00665 [Usitatibacter sp.]|nr:hypothetical protein [Usitatibacter sp.]